LLSLLAPACAPPPSPPVAQRRPPAAASLRQDWLDGGSSLRRQHFERLLDVASQDPEAVTLLEKSAKILKRSGPGDLFGLLSVCPEGSSDGSGGHTFFDFDLTVFSLDLESIASKTLSPQVQAQLDQATAAPDLLRWSRHDFPDYILIRRSKVPTICLVRSMDTSSAYETLLHELTHASLRDPHFSPKKTTEVDADTFLEAHVQAPGDEVDAYVAGTRARIRLDHDKGRVHKQLARFFDDQGNLTAGRPLVARAILGPPPAGLGYAATSLQGAVAKAREAEQAELNSRRRVVEALLQTRLEQQSVFKNNTSVHSRNVKVFQQNADIARASGDKAAQQAAEAKGQEAARQLEEIRRQTPLLEASIKRLQAEQASLAPR